MNRVAHRSTIALMLAIALVVGMVLFAWEYATKADDWVVFPGNPHVYTGTNIGCGIITDREGNVLLNATASREYSDSYSTRLSTLHWLGDRSGFISAPAVTYYSNEMADYDIVNGLYAYSGTGGEARMTISAKLQNIALEAMGDRKGTVAVYNYETGEILCAVSTPTYDPDDVPDISGDTSGKYEGVYLNRFTQVSYVPGSIFKIVTSAAALEMDMDTYDLEFTCDGSYTIEGDEVTCQGQHGTINMRTALAKSCNCYFAQLVQYLGKDTMVKYVDQFRVTEPITFDGITTNWGNYDLDGAANVEIAWSGIGQYTDQVNPARFMTLMGAIGGGGEAALPYIVGQVTSGEKVNYEARAKTTGRLMDADTVEVLTEMLRNNVVSIYGEGNFPGLTVCGKSGTAQVDGDSPHATFAGFVSDEEYPLAFICVVENAGAGSDVCVPILSRVLTACKEMIDSE